MEALYWLFIGIGLIIMELVTPGFILMFFGLAAFLVAIMCWLLPPEFMETAQWYFFGGFSILSIIFLRKFVKSIFVGASDQSPGLPDAFAGKTALVVEEIAHNSPGKTEFNGTNWKAELADPASPPIPKGAHAEIVRRDNLTLYVKSK